MESFSIPLLFFLVGQTRERIRVFKDFAFYFLHIPFLTGFLEPIKDLHLDPYRVPIPLFPHVFVRKGFVGKLYFQIHHRIPWFLFLGALPCSQTWQTNSKRKTIHLLTTLHEANKNEREIIGKRYSLNHIVYLLSFIVISWWVFEIMGIPAWLCIQWGRVFHAEEDMHEHLSELLISGYRRFIFHFIELYENN